MSFHRCSRNGFSSLMYNNYCPFKLMFDDNSFIGAVKFSNCFSEVFLLFIVTSEIDCDKTNLLLKQYWWNAICVASVYSQHMRLMQTPYQLRTHVSAQNWFRFLWQLGVLKMSIEQKIYRWTRAKSNGNWNSWDGFNAALDTSMDFMQLVLHFMWLRAHAHLCMPFGGWSTYLTDFLDSMGKQCWAICPR